TGLTQPIAWLTFNPDGTTLAAADNTGTTEVWDLATHTPHDQPLLGLTAASQSGTLTADDHLVTLGLHAAALWRLRTSRPPLGHVVWNACALCGDVARNASTMVLVAGTGDNYLLWNPRNQRGTLHHFHGAALADVALSPIGTVFAAATIDGRVLL